MKTKLLLVPCLLFFTSIFLTGCIGVDGNFVQLKHEIINSTGVKYHTDVEFSLGAVGLSLARVAVKLGKHHNDDIDVNEMLNCISQVQIGVYKNYNERPKADFVLLRKIDRRMAHQGWQYIVKSCSKGEVSTVYVKQNHNGGLSDMFVLELDHDELTMVQIAGDLDKLFESVIKDKGLDLAYVGNGK